MKRIAPLLFVVFALAAAVPVVALADDTTPPAATTTTTTTTTTPQQAPQGHPFGRIRLEILRLRIQLVHVRYQVICHDKSSDKCSQFTQKVVDRLTTLDKNVQAKLTSLGCSSASTDKRCIVLAKVDQRLQQVIANLGSPAPAASSSTSSDESGLDSAANALGGLNG